MRESQEWMKIFILNQYLIFKTKKNLTTETFWGDVHRYNSFMWRTGKNFKSHRLDVSVCRSNVAIKLSQESMNHSIIARMFFWKGPAVPTGKKVIIDLIIIFVFRISCSWTCNMHVQLFKLTNLTYIYLLILLLILAYGRRRRKKNR